MNFKPLKQLFRSIFGPQYDINKSSFDNATAFTRYEEGGYSSDPRDPGNWTSGIIGRGSLIGSKYGVSAATIVAELGYIPSDEFVKNLKPSFFSTVASKRWDSCGANTLPRGVDLMVFDHAYNCGVSESVKILQRCIKVLPVDGIYGKETLKAASKNMSSQGSMNLILSLYGAQVEDYKSMREFPIYGSGWLNRAAARKNFALSMAV